VPSTSCVWSHSVCPFIGNSYLHLKDKEMEPPEWLRSLPKIAQQVRGEEALKTKVCFQKSMLLTTPSHCAPWEQCIREDPIFLVWVIPRWSPAPKLWGDHWGGIWCPSHLMSSFDHWSLLCSADKIIIILQAQGVEPQELGQKGLSFPITWCLSS
jgi:hypothetical protein